MASADRLTPVSDLRPGMKNVTCVFIVIDRGTTNQIKDGSTVRRCRVADKTGSISFSLWNEQAEAIEAGDILRLVRGYVSVWKGMMVLYSGKYGQLEKTGEFTMVFSELPDMSDPTQEFLHKEREGQDSRNGGGHRDNHHNGNGHGSHGESQAGSGHGQKNSGRLGAGQHGDGRRHYTSSPTTGDYHRPSPPPPPTHTTTSSHPHSAPPTNSHSPLVGGQNHHSQNSGPHHKIHLGGRHGDTGGNRYQPYIVRR